MTLDAAIQIMTGEIVSILADSKPTVYLHGSVVLDDFHLGWSDIDILVLTEREITELQADTLVGLRQALSAHYNGNPYFRLFEGGMLTTDAFLNGKNERVVYWGTSGQRIAENYKMDSFGMAELLDSGILLYGNDIRQRMTYPAYAKMRDDIVCHVQAARTHGVVVGWLLDIARGIYTLRTGKIIAKTTAGEWALEEGICPDADILQKAVQIRKEPLYYSKEDKRVDNDVIQRYADVLECELANTVQRLAETELQHMGISLTSLTLLSNKDGVSVWRVTTTDDSYVMKCFDKPEYRREIANYQLLKSLGIHILKVISHTDCSLVIEDIERSDYRLGTADDMNDPETAKLIAGWYKILHQKGRDYLKTHDFIDEYDKLTFENLKLVQERTGTSGARVWQVIEDNFKRIRSAVMSLPRTLVYTDFHFTNLAVARDGLSALVFDYNFFYKSYVYSDIRNVCWDFGKEAKAAFLSEYGEYDEREVIVDDVAATLAGLIIDCQRKHISDWTMSLLERVEDERLLAAVEKLLESESEGDDEPKNYR